MTSWAPNIEKHKGPRYRAIAEALARDITSGKLEPGSRLPTHRDLADRLGVTVGTVSRAYAESYRRGLVRGEVGRGTFVSRSHAHAQDAAQAAEETSGVIDLSLNFPISDIGDREMAATLTTLASRRGLTSLLEYQPHAGSARHRAAGAAWLARAGLEASPDQIVVCSGAQHAMAIIFSSMTSPSDVVLAERLTYPGMKSVAALLHLDLKGVEIDAEGIRPDAFEQACRKHAPKLLYCVPTIQNPTASVMPAERRREIAAIAEAHQVVLVEDDIYGLLPEDRPGPLCTFAPDSSFHISSLSKSLAPGLRIAYVLTPRRFLERLTAGIHATTWMAAPLMAEIAALWIHEGAADNFLKRKREEASFRQRMATEILRAWTISTHPHSYHLWMELPKPWLGSRFVTRALQRGVAVTPAEAFTVEGAPPDAVRVCLGAARTRSQLEKGLRILVEILEGSSRPDLSIV